MTHLEFRTALCEALLEGWEMRDVHPHDLPKALDRQSICIPTYSVLRHKCVVCNDVELHWYCYNCGEKWMCLRKSCYEHWHIELAKRCRHDV